MTAGISRRMRMAQSSMLLIIVVLAMFAAIALFLLQLAGNVGNDSFTESYANNLLLSVMRTDTGYTDSKCKLVSDLVFCAYFTPEWTCGQSTCLDLANQTIAGYMTAFGNETKSLKYLFTATPAFVSRDDSGEAISVDFGDASLKKSRTESLKINSQPLVISKTVGPNQYTLKLQLIIAKK